MVGFVGTVLHVAAWLCAVIFDIATVSQINSEYAPGAFTFWLWGFIALMIGFVTLLGVTIVHAFSSPESKIPEGGAAPFLMTMCKFLMRVIERVMLTGFQTNTMTRRCTI